MTPEEAGLDQLRVNDETFRLRRLEYPGSDEQRKDDAYLARVRTARLGGLPVLTLEEALDQENPRWRELSPDSLRFWYETILEAYR